MKCDLCGRDISEDSTFKKADAQTDVLQTLAGVRESKNFCDGPSMGEALGMGINLVRLMPMGPTEQQIKEYAKFRLCAQLYKCIMVLKGYSVIINRVQRQVS